MHVDPFDRLLFQLKMWRFQYRKTLVLAFFLSLFSDFFYCLGLLAWKNSPDASNTVVAHAMALGADVAQKGLLYVSLNRVL